MKTLAAIVALAFFVGVWNIGASPDRCRTGQVRGFAIVRGDSRIGIGSLPSIFSAGQEWFAIRYNCSAKSVLAKRVDEGVYDVWFPGNPAKVAIVSTMNGQAASSSVDQIGEGIFRVAIRGPIVENNILVRRELSFYIAVF